MPWIESHSVLVRHRKLKEFARELKIKPVTAMGHLHALWHTAIEQAEDGDLSKWSEGAICDAAQWEGSEKEFLEAVLSSGFMDTGYLLHDWLDYAGRYLTSKYKTSNHERLVEIWAKFGKFYGKEGNRNSLPLPKVSPPNLTEPNLTTKHPPYPPEVLELLLRYPDFRPRPERDGGGVKIVPTAKEVEALVAAWTGNPGYPWKAAVETERGKGKQIRNLGTFAANLPAVTPALTALQAALTAPKAPAHPNPQAWEEIAPEDTVRLLELTPLYFANKLDADGHAEFKALSDKYRRKAA